MTTRFGFTWTSRIDGQVIYASHLNAYGAALDVAFDAAVLEANRALKVPDTENATSWAMTQLAAARASKLMQFGATGYPVASNTLLADVDMGTFRITQSTAATSSYHLVNLSQASALSSFGALPANINITDFNVGALTVYQALRRGSGSALEGYKTPNTIDTERAIRRGRFALNQLN